MKISIIVAASQNWVIGKLGKLPWHLAEDLKHFKKTTLHKPIIMGRKTFESIGKPLPQRTNIVISRTLKTLSGCEVYSSLPDAISAHSATDELMIIGGGEIYKAALPLAHRVYLTEVICDIEGDAFFPPIDANDWQEISRDRFQKSDLNDYPFDIIVLERRSAF